MLCNCVDALRINSFKNYIYICICIFIEFMCREVRLQRFLPMVSWPIRPVAYQDIMVKGRVEQYAHLMMAENLWERRSKRPGSPYDLICALFSWDESYLLMFPPSPTHVTRWGLTSSLTHELIEEFWHQTITVEFQQLKILSVSGQNYYMW